MRWAEIILCIFSIGIVGVSASAEQVSFPRSER